MKFIRDGVEILLDISKTYTKEQGLFELFIKGKAHFYSLHNRDKKRSKELKLNTHSSHLFASFLEHIHKSI